MIKLRWTFIPDYRKSEYMEQVDLIVCYSGKRYIALNVRDLTLSDIERNIPLMILNLKKDMKEERHGRQVRKMRRRTA